jgi:hypothetical protein
VASGRNLDIYPLWEGGRYIVWCVWLATTTGLMVQRLTDGEEWSMRVDCEEANSLIDLLPDCDGSAVTVDLACDYAWLMHGPDGGAVH